MKTTILVIVSLAVGYGLAYYSASKNLAPFNRFAADNAQLKMGESMPASQVKLKQASLAEVARLSNNYVSWITDLAARATKNLPKKDLISQPIVRGGVFSAELIGKLAKGNMDVQYIFGKEVNSSAIYMLLPNPDATKSTSNEDTETTGYLPFTEAGDSATMCPPTCNIILCPPFCPDPVDVDMPMIPPPPPGG